MDMGPGRFDSMEKLFLAAAEKGDKKAILYALENAPDLNINCTDGEGRSALVIAIQNGNSGKNIYTYETKNVSTKQYTVFPVLPTRET